MKKVKKSTVLAVAAVMVAQVGLGVAVATPAQAAVWGCTSGYSSTGPWGYCTSGDSANFRANINCKNVFTGIHTKQISGPWRPVNGGSPSVIGGCGLGEGYYGSIWWSGS
jgi:hypothetical protein